jgi:hypothetical protein
MFAPQGAVIGAYDVIVLDDFLLGIRLGRLACHCLKGNLPLDLYLPPFYRGNQGRQLGALLERLVRTPWLAWRIGFASPQSVFVCLQKRRVGVGFAGGTCVLFGRSGTACRAPTGETSGSRRRLPCVRTVCRRRPGSAGRVAARRRFLRETASSRFLRLRRCAGLPVASWFATSRRLLFRGRFRRGCV